MRFCSYTADRHLRKTVIRKNGFISLLVRPYILTAIFSDIAFKTKRVSMQIRTDISRPLVERTHPYHRRVPKRILTITLFIHQTNDQGQDRSKQDKTKRRYL